MRTLKEEAVTQLILARLNEDRRTSGQTIDVVVVEGDIFLLGWCDTDDQRRTAEMIVRGLSGVRTVIDNVRVRRLAPSI